MREADAPGAFTRALTRVPGAWLYGGPAHVGQKNFQDIDAKYQNLRSERAQKVWRLHDEHNFQIQELDGKTPQQEQANL